MIASTSDPSGVKSAENHKLASVLFILCLHLSALAIALLTQEPEPAAARKQE